MKKVSSSDANRHFSRIIGQVAQGEEIVITSHGKSIALISPFKGVTRQKERARKGLLRRLASQPATGERTWTRDDLYTERTDRY